MIEYIVATEKDLHKEMLDSYVRFMETKQVLYLKEGELLQKGVTFIDDWDLDRLRDISQYLIDCLKRDGSVVLAKDHNQVIGFANLEPTIYFNHYINMPYIHVSRPYRGQGIGEKMFAIMEQEAKKYPVKAIYISTHPSIEAQGFYQKLGCKLATQIIPELYDKEPLDIQLEKELS